MGEYVAPQLPTGTYTVLAELTGFKATALSNVQVGVDQRVRINVTLEVGQMTESVKIEASTPLLQTSSSELGTTVHSEQIQTLPLNGRNFVSLTRTVPGVLRGIPGANIDGAGSLAWRASASFSANGQRARDNNYMLDGVDNNETWLQTVVLFPSVDALDEFKLQTSTYSAEFGRSTGGVVNLQIKSGTNQYHGSGYLFRRDDAFDANNFFNNRAGRKKPDFSQNQFGGTLGGAIFKDKTFFFGDYQGHREKQGQTFLSTVPTAKMRAGDFSELSRVIYDPVTHAPYPGNVIPSDQIDQVAANIIDQLYPEPNTAGSRNATTGQVINNYLINPIKERQDNQFDVKVDHNLTQNNRFFTRYSYEKTHRLQPASLPHGDAGVTFGAGDGNIKAQGLAFNDTHTISSSWLNEFRFGWSQIKFFMTPIDYLQNPAKAVGLPGINFSDPTSGMTQMIFQNIRNLGQNGNQPLITNQNDFQLFDNVTWIRGKHTLKGGGSITFRSRNVLNSDSITGNFQFNNNMTSNCAGQPAGCKVDSTTGFDVASFLLGLAAQKNRALSSLTSTGEVQPYMERRPEYSLYAQDDWRVTSRLTLNLGLRWDTYPPYREDDDRQSNFDETTGQFVVASDAATIQGEDVGRYLQTYSKADFAPRLGFAYDLSGDGKTLIRGGWGKFWNFSPGGTSSSKAQNQPFLQSIAAHAHAEFVRQQLAVGDWTARSDAVRSHQTAAGGRHAFRLRRQFPRRVRVQLQPECSAGTRHELPGGGRLRRLTRPSNGLEGGHQPGPAGRRDQRCERQQAVHHARAARARHQPVQEHRDARLQRVPAQIPAAVREQLLVPELLHVRPFRGLRVRQRGRYREHLRHRLQPRVVGLRCETHVRFELDLRAALGPRKALWRVAGQRDLLLPHGAAVHGRAGPERPVHRDTEPAEPDVRWLAQRRRDDRQVVRHVVLRLADRHHRNIR